MWHGQDGKITTTDRAIVALCALGAAFMGYLTYLHFKTTPGSSFCNFGAGFSCDLVNKSIYAEFMGLPLSLMGLAYFIGTAVLALRKSLSERMRLIQALTVFSLIFSLHLSYIEVFVLGSICVFCEASKAVMLAILLLSTRSLATERRPLRLPWLAAAALAGMFFTVAARVVQTG